jgi:subtilase family serine protease
MTVEFRRGRLPKRTAATIAAAATVFGLSLTGAMPAQAADRVTFADSVPSWATSPNDAGTPAADTSVEGEVYLPLRNAKAAEALAAAVSTPGSLGYRHPLSPQQWIATFAPTKADSDSIVAGLKTQGLTITAVPASREYVVFRGSADAVNAAFATKLHTYNHSGRQLLAPSVAPSLPAALASKVAGVSVDQSRFLTHPDSIQQGDLPVSPDPQTFSKSSPTPTPAASTAVCSNYYGEHTATVPPAYNGKTVYPTFNCGYTPAQLRSAYGLSTLAKSHINGAGQTVAIIDAYASPSIVHDVNTYSASLGEPGLTSATYSQIIPKTSAFSDQEACQEPSGWQGEQTLDVESVHGLAPGAHILYVGGYNCGGGLDVALSNVLDNKLSNIVSNSYSDGGEDLPASVIEGEQNLYIQAAGEGIGLYFSSGDNGDNLELDGSIQADFPGSDPWVTSVGGTSIGIDKSGKLSFETGWGNTLDKIVTTNGVAAYTGPLPGPLFAGGGGGGASTIFAEPSYQKGVVPASLAKGHRVTPDIASLADPYTGFLIGIRPITNDTTLATGPFENETYGGTSLASPLTAAQIAIVQQATHSTIGFANPTLYGLNRILPSSFRDILPQNPPAALVYTSATSGNTYLNTLDRDSSLVTTRGYDNVTGMGELTYGLLSLLAQGRH